MSKVSMGLLLAFLIGAGCRFFDVPIPGPPRLVGALLVVSMTTTSRSTSYSKATFASLVNVKHRRKSICGGPTGETVNAGIQQAKKVRVHKPHQQCEVTEEKFR